MPGRCPLAPENEHFQQDIRQLLYGRGRSIYRILFTMVEVAGTSDDAEVRVLHVRHGARQTLRPAPPTDES